MSIALTVNSCAPTDIARSQENAKDTLSHRLCYALDALRLSQSELARRLGVKPQIIQYICANNVKKSQFTYEIAAALNIDYIWLSTGHGQMLAKSENHEKAIEVEYKTPILEENQILSFINRKFEINQATVSQWLISNLKVPNSTIGIVNSGESMTPLFPKGAILIFDFAQPPKNQNYVLAYIKSLDKLIFRQYIEYEEKIILKPLDQIIYNDIVLQSKDSIVGILIQTHYSLVPT